MIFLHENDQDFGPEKALSDDIFNAPISHTIQLRQKCLHYWKKILSLSQFRGIICVSSNKSNIEKMVTNGTFKHTTGWLVISLDMSRSTWLSHKNPR